MRKLTRLLFLIGIPFFLEAQSFVPVDWELVTTIPVGRNDGELANEIGAPMNTGPSAIAFDKNDNLYISDVLNYRLVKMNKLLQFETYYKDGSSWWVNELYVESDGSFVGRDGDAIAIDNNDGSKRAFFSLRDFVATKDTGIDGYKYYKGLLLITLNDGRLLYIDQPGLDSMKNGEKFQLIQPGNNTEVNQRIMSSVHNDSNEPVPVVDSKNRILLGNEFVTQDFREYVRYWIEKREEKQKNGTQSGDTSSTGTSHYDSFTDDYLNSLIVTVYLGVDSDGNRYWLCNYNKIIIFDSVGIVKYAIQVEFKGEGSASAIHPNGDIYDLTYDGKMNYLYKITRIW